MKLHSLSLSLFSLASTAIQAADVVFSNISSSDVSLSSDFSSSASDSYTSTPSDVCFLPFTVDECRDTCKYYNQLKTSLACTDVDLHYVWLLACVTCGKESLVGTADEALYTTALETKDQCLTNDYPVSTCPNNKYPDLVMLAIGYPLGSCKPVSDRSSCLASCSDAFSAISKTSFNQVLDSSTDYCSWAVCMDCYTNYNDLRYMMIPSLIQYITGPNDETTEEYESTITSSVIISSTTSGPVLTTFDSDPYYCPTCETTSNSYQDEITTSLNTTYEPTTTFNSSPHPKPHFPTSLPDCDFCITTTITSPGYTTITKVDKGKTVTVTEPCETTFTSVITPSESVKPPTTKAGPGYKSTITVTEPCDVCITTTVTSTGYTTVTKVEEGKTVTVTEPCETVYLSIHPKPTAIIKSTVTVTESCDVCTTTTVTSSGYTTVTKVEEGKTVTVTEPCETVYLSIHPKPTATIKSTVTVTESCDVCTTTTVTSSGYTTVTKVEEGKTVTVTEPCETVYLSILSQPSATTTKVFTSPPKEKTITLEKGKTTTVTEPCDECTTQYVTSSGYTTVTKVSEGTTVTVTEPCETTITQVVVPENPTKSAPAVTSSSSKTSAPPASKPATESSASPSAKTEVPSKEPSITSSVPQVTAPSKETSDSIAQVPTTTATTTLEQVNSGVVNQVSVAAFVLIMISLIL
ncbi:uncharacterized protein SAPINGB_P004504 [Magnusiomyces paraingens]|uniref:Flo11 domain-containing protein n=1 Tax=Magnusiomyces paraingens TaxID=2606893 RepID=A0A5E8BX26_9ASCO|nr:uncharacterized protein SAPINGB_P004504 [Saprochaete ingens]VVT55254.1 unnamed protein product [Saprochaete ingens]